MTTWWNVKELKVEGLEILKVVYLPELSTVHAKIDQLMEQQRDLAKDMSSRENIRMERMRLEALHKHRDYESEQEVRLVYFLGDESGSVHRHNFRFEASGGRLRSFIERPVRLRNSLTKLDITLGPTMNRNDVSHWKRVGDWTLRQMGVSGGRVEQSQLKYLG